LLSKRSEIRTKYGIRGDSSDDCCQSCWCPCCVLVQQEREVEAREKLRLEAERSVNVEGYKKQKAEMKYE
jgi:hypothetical protein